MIKGKARAGNVTLHLVMSRASANRIHDMLARLGTDFYVDYEAREDIAALREILTQAFD